MVTVNGVKVEDLCNSTLQHVTIIGYF